MSFNKNEYLSEVLASHKMSHVGNLMEDYREKRNRIKEAMENHYGSSLYSPLNSGSYAKNDAINTKFDLDLVVPFKRDSFSTLAKMYGDVYSFLKHTFKDDDVISVKKQNVSIGLHFKGKYDRLDLDIVPGRELLQDDYSSSKNLNLYVNEDGKSSLQTNIQKQIDHIKGKNDARECVRLLKIWKTQNSKKHPKSFFIELLTIKAIESQYSTSRGIWNKLESVLNFVCDKIEKIRLVDPGNSNNIVSDTMTLGQKNDLKNSFNNLLKNVGRSDENIKLYFKENPKFSTNSSDWGSTNLNTTSFG